MSSVFFDGLSRRNHRSISVISQKPRSATQKFQARETERHARPAPRRVPGSMEPDPYPCCTRDPLCRPGDLPLVGPVLPVLVLRYYAAVLFMMFNQVPRSPTRRWFLRAGLLVGGSVALFGGTVFMARGIRDRRLTPSGKDVVRAFGLAFLDDLLPRDPVQRAEALDRHVANVEAMLSDLPHATRLETSGLLGVLSNMAGRVAMTGMVTGWSDASVPQLQAALDKLRMSPLRDPQRVYYGLRGLCCVTFFTDSQNWKTIGYGGPNEV
jgi:hypothetical protein